MTNFSDTSSKKPLQKVPLIPPASIRSPSRSSNSFPAPRNNLEQGSNSTARRLEPTERIENSMMKTASKVKGSASEPETWSSVEDLFWVSEQVQLSFILAFFQDHSIFIHHVWGWNHTKDWLKQ